jgi:GTP cyclohydrolase I
MPVGSPPLAPKPKSAVPPYLLNGSSPLHNSAHGTSHGTTSARERDTLTSSIKSSYGRRRSIDLEGATKLPKPTTQPPDPNLSPLNEDEKDVPAPNGPPILQGPPRDPRDEVPPISPPTTVSRPASPYTLNPPIDFDGLSWPSTSCPSSSDASH